MKPNEERCIMIRVKAPSIPKTCMVHFQLLSLDGSKKRLCDMLELVIRVKVNSPFNGIESKFAKKINQILQMGFKDQAKIIAALDQFGWDVLKAVNWLATSVKK